MSWGESYPDTLKDDPAWVLYTGVVSIKLPFQKLAQTLFKSSRFVTLFLFIYIFIVILITIWRLHLKEVLFETPDIYNL